MSETLQIGNTFNHETLSFGHARKVWRRIDEQLPGGYVITNVSSFTSAGIIPAGSPVAYATSGTPDIRDIVAIKWSAVKTAAQTTSSEQGATDADNAAAAAAAVEALNIIGFLQEDVVIKDSSTFATGNVIVKGELYGYMCGDTVTDAGVIKEALKNMPQKNGMSIRIID